MLYLIHSLGSFVSLSAQAEMMHASDSTLELAGLADAKGSDVEPQSQAFQFNSPRSMPPR